MPELPQIPVQPVALRQRELDIPNDPRPRAIRNTALITDKVVSDISTILYEQQRNIQDKQSLLEFEKSYTNLRDTVNTIRDTKTAMSVHSSGIQDILGELRQQNPEMSTLVMDRIVTTADKKVTQFDFNMLKKQEQNNKNSLVALIEDSSRYAAAAATFEDGQMILQTGIDGINEARNMRTINDEQATNLLGKMVYDYKKAQFSNLANINPRLTLSLSREQSGLNPDDYRNYRIAAQENIARDRDISLNEWKDKKTNTTVKALSGGFSNDPQGLLGALKRREISDDVYRSVSGGKFPSDPIQLDSFKHTIQDTDWDSSKELKDYIVEHIQSNPDILPGDYRALMAIGADELKRRGGVESLTAAGMKQGRDLAEKDEVKQVADEFAVSSSRQYFNLKNHAIDYTSKLRSLNPKSAMLTQRTGAILDRVRRELDYAKDIAEHGEIAKKATLEIDKLFEGTLRVTTGKVLDADKIKKIEEWADKMGIK